MQDFVRKYWASVLFGGFGLMMGILGVVQVWEDTSASLLDKIVSSPIMLLVSAASVVCAIMLRPKSP